MRKKMEKRKIEAGAIVISVLIGLYVLSTVPAIIADTADPIIYDGEVTIWLNATDNYAGVKGIYYAIDPIQKQPGDPIEYEFVNGSSVKLTEDQPGNHTIHYYAVDNLGNEETPKTHKFTIYADTIAPDTSIEIQGVPYTG